MPSSVRSSTPSLLLNRKSLTQNINQGFAGIITAVAAWSIWGSEMFPAEQDPVGDSSKWADSELKRWLEVVRAFLHI
ncbi:hypothetical protein MMC06_002473 [Schaereria dolodes]|nr:hypothetical protein [Schaereria dolodes]